jgi:putative endonuclease
MKYVYILQSTIDEERFYVGSTRDLKQRFQEHNDGKSIHTNKFKPWLLKTYITFSDPQKADEFETYLKSGSGRAFAKKHL